MTNNDVNQAKVIAKGVAEALKSTPITVTVKNESVQTLGVVECAQVLKNYCEKYTNCNDCPFYDEYTGCRIKIPEEWSI